MTLDHAPEQRRETQGASEIVASPAPASHAGGLDAAPFPRRADALTSELVRNSQQSLAEYCQLVDGRSSPSAREIVETLGSSPGFRSGTLDNSSWNLLDMDDLFRATSGSVSMSRTLSPSVVVAYRQFCNPAASEHEWSTRQDALRLLLTDEQTYESLKQACQGLAGSNLERIFQTPRYGESQFGWNIAVFEALRRSKEIVSGIAATGNDYIDAILKVMTESTESTLFKLAEQGIALTPRGIAPREKGSFWGYVRPYAPFRADPATIGVTMGAAAIVAHSLMPAIAGNSMLAYVSLLAGTVVFATGAVNIASSEKDRTVGEYFRRHARTDADIANFYEGLGRLEELLGWADFARQSRLPITFAERDDSSSFKFTAERLGNALEAENRHYVLNDVDLDTDHIRPLTGPNGGGKSALQRSIAYSIWSAEVAGIATAKSLTYTPPEKVIVHTPTDDRQSEGKSRFQREVRDLADTIGRVESAEKPVLLLLDEMFSSTAEAEAAEQAITHFAYLSCLHHKPAVLLATHNRQLVHALVKSGVASPLQMRWTDNHPAFIVEHGVGETSYASSVVASAEIDERGLHRRLTEREVGDIHRFTQLLEQMRVVE